MTTFYNGSNSFYSRLQCRIIKINLKALFAPSGNHSLNLTSVYAIESMEHSEALATVERVAENLFFAWCLFTDGRSYLHMIAQKIVKNNH